MTMLAEDVATYLVSEGLGSFRGQGTGAPIYINFVPASPDAVIVLTETTGFGDDDNFTNGVDSQGLQVRVRGVGENSATPYATIRAIYNALHRLSTHAFASGRFLTEARAQQVPFFLQIDVSRRTEYVFNIVFRLAVTRPAMEA